MSITVDAPTGPAPRTPLYDKANRRTDIFPTDIDDARMVLRYAVDRANRIAALLHEHNEERWHGDLFTVAVHRPEQVFADPECQDLARRIARRPHAGVRLLFLFTAADFVAKKKDDEQAELLCTGDCPPPLRAAACGCPTLRASVLLGVIAAEVDGEPLVLPRAAR